MARVAPLVSAKWLMSQIRTAAPVGATGAGLKVFDTSITYSKRGYEDYKRKHIPGSLYLDLSRCVKATREVPRGLPEEECFTKYCQYLGITRDCHIVLYDKEKFYMAARTWWMFRLFGHHKVSVLDGGLYNWENEGFETDQGEGHWHDKGNFVIDPNTKLRRGFEELTRAARMQATQILDVRHAHHFKGTEAEPSPQTQKALMSAGLPLPMDMKRGHIPCSVNLHKDHFINQKTKCLKPEPELRELFDSVDINLSRPLTTLCYNGYSAAIAAIAASVCGKDDVSVYNGSWTEWGQRATSSMCETGDDQTGKVKDKGASAI